MDKYFKSLNSFLISKVGAIFIILPFVKPAAEITGKFDFVFDLWKLLAATLIIIGCVRSIAKANRVLYCIIAFHSVLLISTLFNHGDIKTALVQVVSVIAICIYFDYFLRLDYRKAISNILFPLIIMSVLTALTMFIFYPKGMYTVRYTGQVAELGNYLWGFDNASIFNFIPGMYLLGLYSYFRNNKKTYCISLLILLFIFFAFLYVSSITALVGCFAIVLAYYLIVLRKKRFSFFTTRKMVLFVVLIGLVLIIGKESIGILMKISSLTDKVLSIKARFVFWERIISCWKQSPLFGYGFEDKSVILSKLSIDHPHNYFMDVIYRGGLVALFLMILIIVNIIKGKWKDIHINVFSAVSIFVLLFISIFDFYTDHYLFYPMIITVIYSKQFVFVENMSLLSKESCPIAKTNYRVE